MNRILLAVTFLFSALALCADSLKLQLPEKIYAVPGIETNVYFDNIVLTPNSDFYVFDVDCRKGRNDQKRWRFVPTDKDVGEYDWNVKVMDGNGTLAEGKTKLIVSPANAGRGKRISILVVGDSLTNATVYPTRLFELTQGEKNPRLKMIGSNGPNRKPQKNGVAHEGWGGWAWKTFISKTAPYAKKDPKPWDVPSRFLVVKDGKGKLDFQAYLDKYNGGKAPDFITVQLGVNDVFGSDDFRIYHTIERISRNMDELVGAFVKAAPNAVIGIGLPTPGASQDGIGRVYRCRQTRYQYDRNRFMLSDMVMRKYGNGQCRNVKIIPMYHNLDCENNFPMAEYPVNSGNPAKIPMPSDGLHPAPSGGNQLGDTLYAWLKYCLHKGKTSHSNEGKAAR